MLVAYIHSQEGESEKMLKVLSDYLENFPDQQAQKLTLKGGRENE